MHFWWLVRAAVGTMLCSSLPVCVVLLTLWLETLCRRPKIRGRLLERTDSRSFLGAV
jgi:hypothetical protein